MTPDSHHVRNDAPARRRGRRLFAALAALAAASIALTGCLYAVIPEEAPTTTESLAPDTDGVSDDLLPFYEQTLTWSACGAFECSTVTAPLDWADPAAGDIELSVIRQRATSGRPTGSLLINPGGPGASGVEFVRDSLDFAAREPLQQQFDIVGFDPRGVGASTAIRCYDAAQMDAYLFDIPVNQRGSEAWIAERTDAHQRFAEACDANSDGILPFITTENAARDLDLLRAVLGDSQLNYLGYSYGTFLGATFAELYPDRVGRLVLDGAVDPTATNMDVEVTQGVGFESALRAYMSDCLAGSECPFRGTVDEAMADLGTLLAVVEAAPMQGSDGRRLGADSLLIGIVAALYSPDSWPFLTVALDEVLKGNPDVAFQLADFYFNRVDGEYLDNSTEAFRSYNCMDYPPEVSPEERAAAQAALDAGAPTVAPYWLGANPCLVWPYPSTGTRQALSAEGAAPIVVIGTTNDPATPYEWSVALAEQLSSGVLITRVGEGHTGYNKGNACVDTAVEAYLLEGVVPQDGLRCE